MAITINGTGTITGISAGGLPDGVITSADLASGAVTAAALPTGSILQVQQTIKTDADTTTSQESFGDVTGMSVSITPNKASSNILVQVSVGRVGCSAANRTTMFRLMRGTTAIALGDTFNSAPLATFAASDLSTSYSPGGVGCVYLDSPTYTLGDTLTYKLQWSGQNGDTHRLNGPGDNRTLNDAPGARGVSTIIVMEVAD